MIHHDTLLYADISHNLFSLMKHKAYRERVSVIFNVYSYKKCKVRRAQNKPDTHRKENNEGT